ncbi:hypothetical protein C0Q70_08305 [Pomacea canaliculata]|uniref:Sulfotransferase domain-containing protein n=1 Tax=Pomacea canaliculata TaxID=400727 RepID=A0A2T7PHG2_POMCA|nr:sulfotransferase 1A3-like isoform X3 [Pomacea canaliculata]PVD32858.1 hypothetical protein C0Q70_08305 [Pomacea canaliculata]
MSGGEAAEPVANLITIDVDGFPLPVKRKSVEEWRKAIDGLRKVELRDDDILMLCYPKAGTHWLWEVTSMLLQGKAEYDPRRKEQLMMEFVDVDEMAAMQSPRILNSHLPFSMLPWEQIRDKRIKVFHIYRNPKDTVVSFFHMSKGIALRQKVPRPLEFAEYFENFINGRGAYGKYFAYLQQFHKFTQENPDVPVFNLSFEDMKKNPLERVKRIAEFLSVSIADEVCEEIVEACSFQNMKKQAEKKEVTKGETRRVTDADMYRKGEAGDWKNYLTVAMSERLDNMAKEAMVGLPYVLQYS